MESSMFNEYRHPQRSHDGDGAGGGYDGDVAGLPSIKGGELDSLKCWRRVKSHGQKPGPRSGAASVVVGDRMYMFGGYGGSGRLDDFYSYDFEARQWSQVHYNGPSPGVRENNGVVEYQGNLYLFGGYNGSAWLNDFHEFNLTTKTWRLVEPRGTPPASRFGYVSVVHGHKFVLFGGYDGATWLNDTHEFDFRTCVWTQIATKGQVPSIRSCPSWCQDDHRVFVFGGYDGVRRMNDFFACDLDTYTWTQLPCRSPPPSESPLSSGGSSSQHPSQSAIDQVPSPRYFHACAMHDGKMYMFGGYNGMDRLNDLYCYRFDTGVWTRLHGDQAQQVHHHHHHHDVPSMPQGGGGAGALHVPATSRASQPPPPPPPHMMNQHPLMSPPLQPPLNTTPPLHNETPPVTRPPTTARATAAHGSSIPPLAASEDEEEQEGEEGSLFPLHQSASSSSSRAEEDDEASRGLHSMSSLRLGENDAPTTRSSSSVAEGRERGDFSASAQSTSGSPLWSDSPSSMSSSLRTKPLEVPSGRSSLVSVVYKNSLFVFGGYNGQVVLNDFFEFRFQPLALPPPSLVEDLKALVNSPDLSDVTFIVEGQPVYASRIILAARSEPFRAMFLGSGSPPGGGSSGTFTIAGGRGGGGRFKEASSDGSGEGIVVEDVSYAVFVAMLEFLYTDTVSHIPPELAVPLLVAGERWMLPRLKALCEESIRRSITASTVVPALLAAHRHHAASLKDMCLDFLLERLEHVRALPAFAELKQEPDLLMEIIMRGS